MLADADGSYVAHNNRFALTELIDVLEADSWDGWKFVVTKAHRYPKALFESTYQNREQGAEKDKFVFDASFNIGAYDELWMFGIASSIVDGPYKDPAGYGLTDAEVEVIQQFMDAGGGVFATGDHDDLGRDLCGKLPRVRSMRRWHFDYVKATPDYSGYDEASGDSPPVRGPHRHSTIVKNADGHYEFDNQSDDIPQIIRPTLTRLTSSTPYGTQYETFPHPLLCGLDGVINVLPDHMHEGQCQVPRDLTAKYISGGLEQDEYPAYLGRPLPPQVVAWEDIMAREADPSFNDPSAPYLSNDNAELEADTGGAIAAWDGHIVGRGRVAVDATFHHFVNVNVVGVGDDLKHPWTADEGQVKLEGLKNSSRPEAQKAYRHIQQYWRNIASWLAPRNLQDSFSLFWIKKATFDGRIWEELGTAHHADGQMRLGAAIRAVMGASLPPCATLEISGVGIPDPWSILLGHWYILRTLPDPPPDEPNWRLLPVGVTTISNLSLGSAALTVRRLTASAPKLTDRDLLTAMHEASAQAVRQLFSQQMATYEQAMHNAEKWARQFIRA
jgi:hypothetical protein